MNEQRPIPSDSVNARADKAANGRSQQERLQQADQIPATAVPAVTNRAAHWLTSWWHSPAGIRLFAEQAPIIATEVRRFHGDHLLWLGCHNPSSEFVRRCMVRYRFYAAIPGTCPSADIASFHCDPQDLPVAKGSVSAVALHHVLECVPDPRQFIREVARVMEPGGRLLICGFNPLGSWGARALVDRGRSVLGKQESSLRPIARGRLLDWLALLGFELSEEVRYVGYPFAGNDRWHPARRWLAAQSVPFGASSYIVCATKRQGAAQQPPRLVALPNSRLVAAGYQKMSKSA